MKANACGAAIPRYIAAGRFSARGPVPSAALELALHRGVGTGIGFLTVDAPVAQLVQGDRVSGDGAPHEGAGTQDAEIAVQKLDLGFARFSGPSLVSVHENKSLFDPLYATARAARESAILDLDGVETVAKRAGQDGAALLKASRTAGPLRGGVRS